MFFFFQELFKTHELFHHTINLSNCIELDATFIATIPNVFLVPMLRYGIPLGLIVGSIESSEFYSLFLKAFEELNTDLFEELKNKCISTSFEELHKKYNFEFFYCYVLINRSFGTNPAISILVREMLFVKLKKNFIQLM